MNDLKENVESKCLLSLRIASIIQSYFYDEPLQQVKRVLK